ncbi:MAG: FtsX-like permease family protein [Verrucomicrobia bacterium]|nr:FtsX-like permease family protein [Verrucomicrobiota bacterium]
MKFLYLVGCNLRRKKLRTILTLLSILIAFLLYGFLCAVKEALNAGVSIAGADRLVVRHKVSLIQLLPVSYKDRIALIPGVDAVEHQTWFGGIYQDPKNFFAQMPVEPEPFLDMFPEFVISAEAKERWLKTRTGAIVGRKLAERFKWKVGDRVPIQATIWTQKGGETTWEFDIVGIYDAGKKGVDTTQMFFRYDYFDEARAFGEGQVGWYGVRVKDPARAAEVARKIDEEFANSPAETKAEPEGAFVQAFAKQVGDIGTIMVYILSAVFFTILLVAGNTMAQAVRERTEELGVLKAIGFTNAQVLSFVLAESCFISGIGGLSGLGFAWLLIAAGDPTNGALPVFYFPTGNLIVGLILVVVLGLVTGIVPALQAMRLQIADALRRT